MVVQSCSADTLLRHVHASRFARCEGQKVRFACVTFRPSPGLLNCSGLNYFINTSFLCAVNSPALITYRYTPLATRSPRSFVASHVRL